MAVTFNPIVFNNNPVDDAIMPLPTPDITPPTTRTYFILPWDCRDDAVDGWGGFRRQRKAQRREGRTRTRNREFRDWPSSIHSQRERSEQRSRESKRRSPTLAVARREGRIKVEACSLDIKNLPGKTSARDAWRQTRKVARQERVAKEGHQIYLNNKSK